MIVLDTHAWVWWLSEPGKLSPRAYQHIDEAISRSEARVSAISLWEVAILVEHGRLKLRMDMRDWMRHVESLPFFRYVPVDNRIALRSVLLPQPIHRDPADRIIIATALILGAELVSKDERILAYPPVKTIW